MWIIQICLASFWLYLGIHLLFREALVWRAFDHIPWFRKVFESASTRKWERFCRDAGLVSFTVGCLLFINLPYGMGVFGILVAVPPLVFFL